MLINSGSPGQGMFTRTQVGVANPGGRLVAVDLLGHGKRDLVVPGPSLWIFPNQGNGSFGAEQEYEHPKTTPGGGAVVSDDFNGDGRPDLAVVTNAEDGLGVLLNTCTP